MYGPLLATFSSLLARIPFAPSERMLDQRYYLCPKLPFILLLLPSPQRKALLSVAFVHRRSLTSSIFQSSSSLDQESPIR